MLGLSWLSFGKKDAKTTPKKVPVAPLIQRVKLIVVPQKSSPWCNVESDFLSILMYQGIEVLSDVDAQRFVNHSLLQEPEKEWRDNHAENTFLIIIRHEGYASGTYRVYDTNGKLVAAGREGHHNYTWRDFANVMFVRMREQIRIQASMAA